MLLELRTVSRKTPGDGKLEVTAATAQRLSTLGSTLPVLVGDAHGAAVMSELACTCAKAGGAHVHHFLQSDLFRAFVPDMRVRLELDDEAGTVRLSEQD